jgi:hypothetical protein
MGPNRETLNYVIAISDICETDNAKDFYRSVQNKRKAPE